MLEYEEIFRDITSEYEQIISVNKENMIFRLETVYNERLQIANKVMFIGAKEVTAMASFMKMKGWQL